MTVNEKLPRPRRDRLKQYRAFCYAARLLSISEAAERIFSSQPAVSQQVRALEEQLAVTLFERSGQRIALTPAGQRLHALAGPLVECMDRLPDTFAERYRGVVSGSLDIAVGQTVAAFVLPGYLRRLQKRHPGIQVNMRITDGRQRLHWLRNYEVDVVFAAVVPPPPSDLEFRPVFSSGMVLITPEDHPLAGRDSVDIAEAVSYPAVLHPAGQYVARAADIIMRRFGHVANCALEIGGWNVIKHHVEAGVGISVVPEICVTEKDRVWKISAAKYFPPRVYGLLTRRDDMLPLAAEWFVRIIDPGMSGERVHVG